jgi:hypothetical protein
MDQVSFVVAFILLWAFLGIVTLLVLKVARKVDQGNDDGPSSPGL